MEGTEVTKQYDPSLSFHSWQMYSELSAKVQCMTRLQVLSGAQKSTSSKIFDAFFFFFFWRGRFLCIQVSNVNKDAMIVEHFQSSLFCLPCRSFISLTFRLSNPRIQSPSTYFTFHVETGFITQSLHWMFGAEKKLKLWQLYWIFVSSRSSSHFSRVYLRLYRR